MSIVYVYYCKPNADKAVSIIPTNADSVRCRKALYSTFDIAAIFKRCTVQRLFPMGRRYLSNVHLHEMFNGEAEVQPKDRRAVKSE